MKNCLIVLLFSTFFAASIGYDTSGCEKFMTALISASCEHASKVDECNKCVSDGLNGGNVEDCKSHVPDKFGNCFKLAPLLQKVKITDLGAEFERCMSMDVCSTLGEYADQIPEYAKMAKEQADNAKDSVKVSDECKNEASEQGKKAQEATEEFQNLIMKQMNKHGTKYLTAGCNAMKAMFNLSDDDIDNMTSCGTSVAS